MKNNETAIEEIFRAAREAPPVVPPNNFADQVMSLTMSSSAEDGIAIDFPLLKIAWAASFVIAAFLASEVIMYASGFPSLGRGAEELTSAYFSELEFVVTP